MSLSGVLRAGKIVILHVQKVARATEMLGNTRVQNCSSSDGNVGQYSCSKLFFERRKCWEKLVLLSEIFRKQMLGNTCVLERVFRTQMLGNSCVPEQGFEGRKKCIHPPPHPPPLLFPCMIFLLLNG